MGAAPSEATRQVFSHVSDAFGRMEKDGRHAELETNDDDTCVARA